MADPANIFDYIFTTLDDALETYILDVSSDIISFITPIFTSMMIIWIAIWGYMMWFGQTNEPLKEGVFRILRIGFIISLGLTVGTYNGVVVSFLYEGPETIASIISGNPSGMTASLDEMVNKIFSAAKATWEKAGIALGNFGLYLLAGWVAIVGSVLMCIIAFLIVLSKIAMTVLLALGPLFISMLLFSSTQRFFESWLGQVLNYGFILILGTAVGNLVLEIDLHFIDQIGTDQIENLVPVGMMSIVFGISIMVLKQVPEIASALGGGATLAADKAINHGLDKMRYKTNAYRQRAKTGAKKIGGAGYRAYQKRFSKNQVSGS